MKKYISILSIIISFFILAPVNVSATSGACSYHGGVNCYAGGDYNGKVQCNDGWINSSVYFFNTDECRIIDNCPQIVHGLTCTTEADYLRVQQEVNSERENRSFALGRAGMIGSGMDDSTTLGQDKLDSCRKYIVLYDGMVASREQCLASETEKQRKETEKIQLGIQIKFNTACSVLNGVGSFWDNSLPYDIDGTKCIPTKKQKDALCEVIDKNSYYEVESNLCVCKYGYAPNENSQCSPEQEVFNQAFNKIFDKALNDNIDFPKNIDREVIKKIALTSEYKNTPIAAVIRKYAKDNNLLVSIPVPITPIEILPVVEATATKEIPAVIPPMVVKKLITSPKKNVEKTKVKEVIKTENSLSTTQADLSQYNGKTPTSSTPIISETGSKNNDLQPVKIKENVVAQVNPEPIKKVKWYQRIFNWFKGK